MSPKTLAFGTTLAGVAVILGIVVFVHVGNEKGQVVPSPRQRLDSLWQSFDSDLQPEKSKGVQTEILKLLAAHPDLDEYFLDRFITRADDEYERGAALGYLRRLGRRRPFDHGPLVDLVMRGDLSQGYKLQALSCVIQLANYLDLQVLLDLLDDLPDELRRSGICDMISALDSVRDRDKALRLLQRCLVATDTTDPKSMVFLLDQFVNRKNGNEDILDRLLRTDARPHEKVIIAVSLMSEELPTDSPYRRMAESEAEKSKLADDYYNLYVGSYIANKRRD